MSKPVKELVRKELARRFEGLTSLAVVGFTGIDAITTHQIRGRLRDKNIKMTVVKNALARQAFDSIGLSVAKDLLDGPCAVAFGADQDQVSVIDVVRELVAIGKETPNLKVKAAILEGEAFGPDRVEALSKYPTRDEAICQVLTCTLSPGAKLTASILAPGIVLGGLIKAIQESKTEESGDEAAA